MSESNGGPRASPARRAAGRLVRGLLVVAAAAGPGWVVAAPTRVVVALPPDAVAAPVRIAAEGGYFAAEGLDVTLTKTTSEAAVGDAVASGHADFGVASLGPEYFGFAATHRLTAIASVDADRAGYVGDALVIGHAASDAGFDGWRNIAGRRIGVRSATPEMRYAIAGIATKYGIDRARVTVVAFDTLDDERAALTRGEVDAALFGATDAARIADADRGVRLRRVGDELDVQKTVIVVDDRIGERGDLLDRFMRAYRRAASDYDEAFLQRDDDGEALRGEHDAAFRQILAPVVDAQASRFAYVVPWVDHLGRLDVADYQRQLRYWQAAGGVPSAVTIDQVLDRSLVRDPIGTVR